MDTILRIRLELDEVKTEHLRRPCNQARKDLLEKLGRLNREASDLGIEPFIVTALARTAEILLDADRPGDALKAIDEALSRQGGDDPQGRGVDLLCKKARALALLKDWPRASEVCQRGIETVESFRRKVTPLGLQSAYLRFRIELYQIGVLAAMRLGDYELALSRAELAKCATARRLVKRSPRDKAGLDAARAAYRQICEQLSLADLTEEARAQLRAKRNASWDAMTISRFRDDAALEHGSALEARNALADGELLLYYFWVGPRQLAIFLLTRHGLDAELRQLSDADTELLQSIPNAILKFQHGEGTRIAPKDDHARILLPESFEKTLLKCKRAFISPHRSLHMLPFHALRLGDQDLIGRMSVSYVPNLNPLFTWFEPTANPSLLALAVPETQVLSDGQRMQPLTNVANEVNDVKAEYVRMGWRAKALIGPEAREATLWSLDETGVLAGYRQFHFACHGTTVDSESPLESSLALYDAAFDGLDIAGLELDADIAVLSACCSGQRPIYAPRIPGSDKPEELPGDELFGLQAAFFSAGVRQLVSTMWPVDSAPARKITRSLHQGVLAGQSPDVALQRAIIEFRSGASLYFRGVESWGPFFLVAMARPRMQTTEG